MTDVSQLLADYPIVTTIPVLWGDEDAFAHVNNLAYLRWCETARVEYMQRVAFWTETPSTGTGPIIASVKCDYKAPLTYPDTVDVGTRVTAIGNSSVRIDQVVVSRKLQAVAALVDSTVVLLDYSLGRPVRVPEEIRAAIGALEGRALVSSVSPAKPRPPPSPLRRERGWREWHGARPRRPCGCGANREGRALFASQQIQSVPAFLTLAFVIHVDMRWQIDDLCQFCAGQLTGPARSNVLGVTCDPQFG